MLTITKPCENRVDITLDGGIDANIMTAGLDEFFAATKDIEDGVLLYTISDFDMPTLGAIGVKLTQLPQLLGLVGKFDKIALLSNNPLIKVAGEVEGFLIPGLDIKGFHLNEKALAEDWLAGKQGENILV